MRSHNCLSVSIISLHLIQQSFISLITHSSHYLLVSFFRNLCINQANLSISAIMQFTTSFVMSLALALTASAAPVVSEGVEGKVLVERQVVQQMSSVSCNTNTQTKGVSISPKRYVSAITDKHSVRPCQDQREDQRVLHVRLSISIH